MAAVFKFYNTWNNGAGVQNMTSTDYLFSGQVLNTLGYCMDFKLTRLVKLTTGKFRSMVRFFWRKRGAGAVRRGQETAARPHGREVPAPLLTEVEKGF